MKNQPLLLGCFHSMGDRASHPLESLHTRETQTPFCQIRHEEPGPTNAC
jgi:hypothetical protein